MNQSLDFLREIMGVDTPAEYRPAREGDIKHSYAAVDKLIAHGYKPSIGFKEGLQRTVQFYKDAHDRQPVS